jgi:probable HAF family extracellular repeat protein
VFGISDLSGNTADRVFQWQDGVMTDLGPLGSLGGTTSYVRAINDQGQVVGDSYTSNGAVHPFLWQGGVMTDLGTLGGSFGSAWGLNDQGQVVGYSSPSGNTASHGFLWQGGLMSDLGGFNIPLISYAYGLNDQGDVVGSSKIDRYYASHAFLWQDGMMTDLGTLPGFFSVTSQATAINNAGQVVGGSYGVHTGHHHHNKSHAISHAFLWQDGVMTDLGTLGGDSSFASAINDLGQVVGSSKLHHSRNSAHAFLWQDGVMNDLGTFGGGAGSSQATGINNQGEIVGYSELPTFPYNSHAFLWQSGRMTDLGTLGGVNSYAYGINNWGQVVGWSFLAATNIYHAFLWQDGMMTDLGSLGASSSFATGINDQGQVVGDLYFPGRYDPHPFVWQDGVMTDLNSLLSNGAGWTLTHAAAINQGGQIVGYGTNPDGLTHAFLLTPDQLLSEFGRLGIRIELPRAVAQPQALFETVVAPKAWPPDAQDPVATSADRRPQTEMTLTSGPAPVVAASFALDRVFEGWRDSLPGMLVLILVG